MNLQEFERDISIAYLNYDNNDLKTAVKQLDRSVTLLLSDDRTLDPFWSDITKNVYKAIILNNFTKGYDYVIQNLNCKSLREILNNQDVVYNNIIEFCNKFEGNIDTPFASSLKNINTNPLKSAIEILQANIDKLGGNTENIKNNRIEENSTYNSNIVEDIKCFDCGNLIKMDWSKVPNTEKTVYLKCSKCGMSLKRGNPYATTETNNIPQKETINTQTESNNEQLISELRSKILNYHSNLNIFEDWNDCKNQNPQFKEFFDETEKRAKEELIEAKDKATVLNRKLSTYLSIPNSNELLIEYFGIMSIYDMKAENIDGKLFESMSIDNVGLFRAVLMINIVAIMYHISDPSLPMGLKVIFERKEFADIIGPIIKDFLPKVIPSVNEIKFFAKS